MRIAFTHVLCWPEVRRGAERFTQMLGAALARRGHEVTLLSSAWDPGVSTLEGVRTVRLKRRHEPIHRHEADFGRRVLPRLLAGRYDVVHSLGRRDAVASLRATRLHRERRTVITDLGLPSREWWATQGADEARAVEAVVEGIDVYSCMSTYALDFLGKDYGRHDGVVIPGGVSLADFSPAPSRTPAPTMLFSGALTEPRKGVAVLLEALALIAESEPGVRLWLSGPGDPSELLGAAPAAARDRTEVLGLGDARKQHERYGQAWATVLPSTHDSFGMALVESLACGTPLVVTTHGAPQELVSEGVTGERCPPNDAQALAEACMRVFDLARDGATVDACRASAAPFDWDQGLAPWCEHLYEHGAAGVSPTGFRDPSSYQTT